MSNRNCVSFECMNFTCSSHLKVSMKKKKNIGDKIKYKNIKVLNLGKNGYL